MRPGTNPDGFEYWEYCLYYVDDVLLVSHEPQKLMDTLPANYTLAEESLKEPDLYLEARISKHQVSGSNYPSEIRWTMNSHDYFKSSIDNLETELNKIYFKLPVKVEKTLSSGYAPDLDSSNELTPRQVNC